MLRAESAALATAWRRALAAAGADRWNHAKDDVPPEEIFRLQEGGSADRARLARYCIKDVHLTVELLGKILAVENNVAFGNITHVPLSWVTDRGVGVKLFSLLRAGCRKRGYVMPRVYPQDPRENRALLPLLGDDGDPAELRRRVAAMLRRGRGELHAEAVEGACVLEPELGIFLQHPVGVVDYTSLYPSEMQARNLSPETVAYLPEHVPVPDGSNRRRLEARGLRVFDVPYEARVYTDVDPDDGRRKEPRSLGRHVARFVCPVRPDGTREPGVIPAVLQELLTARKDTKRDMKRAEKAGNAFLASVLNGRQLAYKVACNSVYGGTGSRMSSFRYTVIASATTAGGRAMLHNAKDFADRHFADHPLDLPDLGMRVVGARTIYGDTDSTFLKFTVVDAATGAAVLGRAALPAAIRAGEHVERAAADQPWMLPPHVLEYEKTYFPFAQMGRKKYVGMKYAAGKTTPVLNSMGIVLKRRDNPPILKRIYGDIIDALMRARPFGEIVAVLRNQVRDLLMRDQEAVPRIDDLAVTKRLRDGYKHPERIAHKVLADRQARRDPGNAPKSNDRVRYVFFKNPGAALQGDRIETPEYIREHRVPVDFEHYVTNVIMKPVSQVIALRLEELPGFDPRRWATMLANLANGRRSGAKTAADADAADRRKKLAAAEKKAAAVRAALAEDGPAPPLPPKTLGAAERAAAKRRRTVHLGRIRRRTKRLTEPRPPSATSAARCAGLRRTPCPASSPARARRVPPSRRTSYRCCGRRRCTGSSSRTRSRRRATASAPRRRWRYWASSSPRARRREDQRHKTKKKQPHATSRPLFFFLCSLAVRPCVGPSPTGPATTEAAGTRRTLPGTRWGAARQRTEPETCFVYILCPGNSQFL